MSIQLCLLCGESRPTTQGVCETCTEDCLTIRSYIQEKPMATVMEISNATKIPLKRINQYIDKGKFILVHKDQ